MVRLKGGLIKYESKGLKNISIPYGAIKSSKEVLEQKRIENFNSLWCD